MNRELGAAAPPPRPADPQEIDRALIERFQRGDTSAFNELVMRHQERTRALCLRWLKRPALADEVAQDVFLSVYRNLGRFRGDARFSTWLYRVTVNHCKNKQAYRARRHEKAHESTDASAAADHDGPRRELPDRGESVEQALERKERLQMMREAMDELPEDQRRILLLRDVEDLNYEEIGQILGLELGTVKSRIFRARKKLAGKIGRRLLAAKRRAR